MIDEKVLIERLTDAGGCDAKEDYFKGWDDAIGEAISIVNQLAEESNLTPCYLGSPCEYQNEDAKMPMEHWDNGWIPCENELPKEYTDVLGCDYNGHIYVLQLYKDSIFGNIWRQWNGGLLRLDVIVAWQPLPAPFKPKE